MAVNYTNIPHNLAQDAGFFATLTINGDEYTFTNEYFSAFASSIIGKIREAVSESKFSASGRVTRNGDQVTLHSSQMEVVRGQNLSVWYETFPTITYTEAQDGTLTPNVPVTDKCFKGDLTTWYRR
jgi:hypothetical protein